MATLGRLFQPFALATLLASAAWAQWPSRTGATLVVALPSAAPAEVEETRRTPPGDLDQGPSMGAPFNEREFGLQLQA